MTNPEYPIVNYVPREPMGPWNEVDPPEGYVFDMDFVDEHAVPMIDIGLGNQAVRTDMHMTDDMMHGRDIDAHFSYRRRNSQLDEARAQLEALDSHDRQTANALLQDTGLSPGLRVMLTNAQERAGQRRTVTGGNTVDVVTAVDDDDQYIVSRDLLRNVLQHHNYELVGRQRELRERAEGYKTEFAEAVTSAAARGDLPEEAVEHLERLEKTTFFVDDGFSTVLYKGDMGAGHKLGAARRFRDGNDALILSPRSSGDRVTRYHEMFHLIDGRDAEQADEIQSMIKPMGPTGLYRLFGERGGKIMDEAVVEHEAQSLVHGDFDTTDPGAATRLGAAYSSDGQLLHTLSKKGRHPVDIRLITATHLENDFAGKLLDPRSAQHKLVQELATAFPFTNVVGEISRLDPDNLRAVELYAVELARRVQQDLHPSRLRLGRQALSRIIRRR